MNVANRQRRPIRFLAVLVVMAAALAGCVKETTRNNLPQPKTRTILSSANVSEAPKIDGAGGDKAWKLAKPLVLKTQLPEGAKEEGPDVTIKSINTKDRIHFLVTWADASPGNGVRYWRYDGVNWSRDGNGDRICFFWNIDHSINGFDKDGCATVCHKEPGTKFIKSARRMREERSSDKYDPRGDIWKWAPGVMQLYSVVSDGYFFATPLSSQGAKLANEAVVMFDNGETGTKVWWTMNKQSPTMGSEDNPYPFYDLLPGLSPDTTPFPYQSQMQKIADYSVYKEGAKIPLIALFDLNNKQVFPNGKPEGSSIDITGMGKWENGRWTLEISRKKDTKHNDDVLFNKTTGKDAYYTFGVAVFLDDEPLHFTSGPAALVFEKGKP